MAHVSQRPLTRQEYEKTGLRGLWASQKFQERLLTAVCTLLCVVGVVLILFPIGWMISTSLKTRAEAVQFPPSWLPADPQWVNYSSALLSPRNPFSRYFVNTMYYALMVMIGETLSCAFIAYGFARLRAPGKELLFLAVLGTMMLPAQVTLIPTYVLFAKLG